MGLALGAGLVVASAWGEWTGLLVMLAVDAALLALAWAWGAR